MKPLDNEQGALLEISGTFLALQFGHVITIDLVLVGLNTLGLNIIPKKRQQGDKVNEETKETIRSRDSERPRER